MARDVWIFGYGSLIWRPGFPYRERRGCFVADYRRRFGQGSTDHRGVPGAPGRVVTLLEKAGERCWGVAYRVDRDEQPELLASLDHREKGGYARRWEPVREHDGAEPFANALVYIATPDNPNYLGCAPLPEIAEQVARSVGPSGPNLDYVLRLAASLRDMGAHDDHVFRLERLLRDARATEP